MMNTFYNYNPSCFAFGPEATTMTIHKLNEHRSLNDTDLVENSYGETPLPFSPRIQLENGVQAIPQQFLQVRRSRASLEKIVSEISFSDDYPLFVGEENGVLYLQASVIGKENYPSTHRHKVTPKIVYGRKWLIEKNTPTSEVVQTALLALKKIREHEVREKLFFSIEQSSKTTPFNTHMDLPLMANNPNLFETQSRLESLEELLARIKVSSLSLSLLKQHDLGEGRALLEIQLVCGQRTEQFFPELVNKTICLVLDSLSKTNVLHELNLELIKLSDRYIEEKFAFNGFARFSRQQCPERIAEFSVHTRTVNNPDQRFTPLYKKMTHQVDYDRAPEYSSLYLGEKQRQTIDSYKTLDGHLPKDRLAENINQLSTFEA